MQREKTKLPTTKEEMTEMKKEDYSLLSDHQIVSLCQNGLLPSYKLEAILGDLERAVVVRRLLIETNTEKPNVLGDLPYKDYDYKKVFGACAENVVGYLALPLGIAGPLNIDGEMVPVPMATTEGVLIASTHRGMSALNKSGGVTTVQTQVGGMTRAPLLRLPSAKRAVEMKEWLEKSENFIEIVTAYNSTSRFGRLISIKPFIAGRNLYLRFRSKTGDAMGMNMVSKGVESALFVLQDHFPDMEICSVSGNVCTDKKASAVNWIEGRGQSIVAEATLKKDIVEKVLKTKVKDICDLNLNKNLIGSAVAASIGGFNAHAANLVASIFLATGQDPAQVVESSNCITLFEEEENGDMFVSVSMPSIEVGTVGGGTHLAGQSACLKLIGVHGSHSDRPGDNAKKLARVVAASVLAGELSLMSALAAGHLVRAHMEHNRKK
eukprot:CAMPEP_0201491328 /NCGR_PEP_ID=MMETSP0151_2-20130828/29394_1 /ASSEMBLY_ACC=CAM_ASM_000257 /TAXON_ID=200890 /ORGANISM="Paramoeba atlantica, Strain 621/1 / CCAP 1560/9" /LENGTH=436 /DNA_ID=CAMNT_0047877629 /DNA_START=243 /DNA_END=1553 /DNA_ORIENTATION=+